MVKKPNERKVINKHSSIKRIMMDKSIETTKTIEEKKSVIVAKQVSDEKFKPKGAIAFFVLLILICAAIWYSIYYIQLMRQ